MAKRPYPFSFSSSFLLHHHRRRGRRQHHRRGEGGQEALPGTHASLLQPGEDRAPHAAAHAPRQLPPAGQRPAGDLPDASDGRGERPGVALQQQGGAGAGVCEAACV